MLWYQTRLAAFVLSAALVLPGSAGLPAASASDEPEEKVLLRYGDINGDKRIDASDALIALQHSVALVQLKGDDFIVANVDGKQGVGSSDALLILQRSVGLNRLFPAEEEPVFDRILDAELSMQESSYRSISGEQIQQLCDSLQSDGSWLGINYADQGNAGWNPPSHLSNIRNMLGVEELAYLAVDDDDLYVEIIDTVGNLCYRLAERILEYGIRFEYAHFWEDICFKNGPLVRPEVFDELVGRHYRRLTELVNRHGIDIVSVDCDGCIDLLVPVWLKNGVNTMFPIEVGTWNASIRKWRELYGPTLRGVGGMDKRVFAHDRDAVDAEIERLKSLVALGGYIPCPDHRIAPDAKFELVQYYCRRFREVIG